MAAPMEHPPKAHVVTTVSAKLPQSPPVSPPPGSKDARCDKHTPVPTEQLRTLKEHGRATSDCGPNHPPTPSKPVCRQLELQPRAAAPATPQNVMWLRVHFARQRVAYEQAHAATDMEESTDPIEFGRTSYRFSSPTACVCAPADEPWSKGYLSGTRVRAKMKGNGR